MEAAQIKDILSHADYTLLSPTATEEQIRTLADDGKKFGVAAICVPPCYVRTAKKYLDGSSPALCTVVGFPHGANLTAVKVFEAQLALSEGAVEIDMVINITALKNGDFHYVKREIEQIRKISPDAVLKVIIESCLLTEAEKIEMCRIVSESGADYIKTSTGFSTGGATFDDIELFRKYVSPDVKIKAAGGISDFETAAKFLELGASRLGTSKLISLAKKQEDLWKKS